MRIRTPMLAAALLLAGCMSDSQKMALQEQADTPLTCEAGADCDAKWRRAQEWIEQNSRFEIDKVTDQAITTDSASGTTSAVMSAKKIPDPEMPGTYSIIFHAECQNMMGCIPTELQLQAGFTEFVDATPPTDDSNDAEALGLGFAQASSARVAHSLIIATVAAGSPAAKAGLKPGDRLIKFNGMPVTSATRLGEMTAETPPGSMLPVQFMRDSRMYVIYVRM